MDLLNKVGKCRVRFELILLTDTRDRYNKKVRRQGSQILKYY